jgi:hypothetical protein
LANAHNRGTDLKYPASSGPQPVVDNSGICAAAKSDWLMDICVHPMAEPRQLANTVQRIRCHNPSAALPFERLI